MRLILKILAAPLVVALTLFVWICTILLYCTGMVLGLAALVVALLGMAVLVILSRLVDTFFARISLTMQPPPKPHNTACVLPWEEDRHWQSRSSGCSSS